MKSIKVFAPATIANINVGFDVLGLALDEIGDCVELTVNGTSKNKIVSILNGPNLPLDVEKNCCSVVIRKMQESLQSFVGVDIILQKGFSSGSGMGSSSASSAAAAFAYNKLVDSPFSDRELVLFAAEGERVAYGSAHIDNVAPAILGGIVLATSTAADAIISLPILNDLYAISFFPHIEINTLDSRKILRANVPVEIASQQIGLMGSFIASLYTNNASLFSNSLQDLIVEPVRKLLIPRFDRLKMEVLDAGALAFGISGSGPSLFAFVQSFEKAQEIQRVFEQVYQDTGIEIDVFINRIHDQSGARIID